MTHFKNVYMFWGQTGFGLNASESSTQTGSGIIFEDEVSSVMTEKDKPTQLHAVSF